MSLQVVLCMNTSAAWQPAPTMPAAKAAAIKVANAVSKAAKEGSTAAAGAKLKKLVPVSPTLKKFLGVGETTRTETIKKVWDYIKDQDLQDPEDRRQVVCDEKLKLVLGQDRVKFQEISKLISPHFPKKEDKKS